MNLFVANISNSVDEAALKALFSDYGEVESAKIIMDKYTGSSKGYGFIEINNEQHAQEAMEALNNKPVDGKNLVVSKARPRTSNY
ncbi:MAG: RNA-binding protein [Cyclobacteriaceae bacterium]|nr:RNA-binding protein [Cyclobacteriaceae bacterium]